MTLQQILDSFIENYTIVSPAFLDLEIDSINKLPNAVSIPELLVFMEARRILGDLDYYSLHVWKEMALSFLHELTETDYLISETSDYRSSGEEVRASVMLAGEIETNIETEKSVIIFWPKNTYGLAQFTLDLEPLEDLDSYNGRYPVTVQGESDLPNMIMLGGRALSEQEIQTRFPDLLDHYNMAIYSKDHFYPELVTELSELHDLIISETDPDYISIGRLNVLTSQGLITINTQDIPPSGQPGHTLPYTQDTIPSTVESLVDKTTTSNVNSILGYAIISCIMLIAISTGIGLEVPVEVLFA